MRVHILGCSGAIAKGSYTSAFLVDGTCLFDAGTGLGQLTLDEMLSIEHIFLTHSHLDHIAALPLMLDAVITSRSRARRPPITVYAPPETLVTLRKHIFNGLIWPDFTRLPSVDEPVMRMQHVSAGERFAIADTRLVVEVLPAVHTVPAVGYAVGKAGEPVWVYTGDTEINPALWQRINRMKVAALVIETAFSNQEAHIAQRALHLSPRVLANELDNIDPSHSFPIYITHTKPAETAQIMREIEMFDAKLSKSNVGEVRHDIRMLQTGQILEL